MPVDEGRIHRDGGSILRTSRANPTKSEKDLETCSRTLIDAVKKADILFCLLHDKIDKAVVSANPKLSGRERCSSGSTAQRPGWPW